MNSEEYIYINVAIGLPVRDPYTYKVSLKNVNASLVGCRVLVSFKNRSLIGYVVSEGTAVDETTFKDIKKVKSILQVIDDEPILTPQMIKLTKWIRDYYLSSWGEAIENGLPAYLKTKKKSYKDISLRKKKEEKKDIDSRASIQLNDEQSEVLGEIEQAITTCTSSKYLLFGVTGSGKTEVYVRAIQKALSQSKSAICLFPEIALTNHLEDYFAASFGDRLAIVHSRLTPREKFLIWRQIKEGKKRVVIGPRSALFAPVKDLGIIVIDEEHENTYKQNEIPRYHTREVAIKRCELEKAVIVCGGATPSLETMHKASGATNTFTLLSLPNRIINRPLPDVKVIDMRHEIRNQKGVLISNLLKNEIEKAINEKEGVLLFLNRRGFATTVMCIKCGEIVECKRCKVALTYHQSVKKMVCHYCDYETPPPETCLACNASSLRYSGVGTEKIESFVARLFPTARIERLDTDRVKKKGESEIILSAFRDRKIDILIGTQMITKGFDFPHVTLVGVINADTVLSLPDFRSTERTFQLLTQVAGRAGRGDKKGTVVIQTFSPEHYAIQTARKHDYMAFYNREIECRRELNYPPFSHLTNIIIRGKNEKDVRKYSERVKKELNERMAEYNGEMLGPAPLPFYRLRGYYRWHIMIKGAISQSFLDMVRSLLDEMKKTNRSCQIMCDIDPVNIL